MPRFHLHFENSIGLTRDPDGQVLPDLEAAIAGIRDIVAEETRSGLVDLRGRIFITDAQDRRLSVISFADAIAVRCEGEPR